MAFTQQNRQIEFTTPLGPDVLMIRDMSMEEELGRLFNIDLELVSEDQSINFEDLLGQNVTIRLDLPGEKRRYFNGFVSRFSQSSTRGHFAVYQATVKPWLWFLTRTADCRIFQHQAVPDIIKEIFRELGFTDFEDRLSGSYRTWDYCVQYRETDFNFVSRLMEQEGFYYYFKHEEGKHTLIFADGYGSHETIPDYAEIPYYPPDFPTQHIEHINSVHFSKQIEPGAYVQKDYDFTAPRSNLKTDAVISRPHEEAAHEIFDYPGEYIDANDGDKYTRARIEELHTQYEQCWGQSTARGLFSGGLFSLTEYPRADQNREYLLVSVTHNISSDVFESSGEGGGTVYGNDFSVIEGSAQFRAMRTTPKPMVQGPQTAIVTGPGGEEIYTDEYGRVKVQFHWDRLGREDQNSSCWIRVSQVWAGKNWGGIQIPRIGQEVIVEFLEGDPDRPIITGRVYNADQMPPYDLPSNKTQSGIKSRSSLGGSGANFNEIRFEDKIGEEQVYVHAEKNQDNIVELDETTDVGNDRTETVGNNEDITIGNNRTEKVGANEDITIGVNRTEKVGSMEDITIGINRTEKVGAMEDITIGANRSVKVAAMDDLKVGAVQNISVGAVKNETIGAAYNLTVGGPMMINVGASCTVVSPLGTKFIDSWLDKMGGTIFENYGMCIGATPMKMEANGTVIETKGVHMDTGALFNGKVGALLQKAGAKLLSTDSAILDKAGIAVAKAGIHMIG